MGRTCRKFKELFVEIRERASKALFFAKMLSKVRKIVKIPSFCRVDVCVTMCNELIGFGDCS